MTLETKLYEAPPEVLARFIRTTSRARTRSAGIRRAHRAAVRVYRERGLSPISA